MPVRLALRVDAGQETGLGHLVRTKALLDRLETAFELTVLGRGAPLHDSFPDAPVHGVDIGDAAGLVAALDSCRPDAVLVDLPRYSLGEWAALRGHPPVVAIDDYGGHVEADLIINGTAPPEYHRYEGTPSSARFCLGPRYTLIRPDFADHPWQPDTSAGVAIVVGGGSRAAEWAFFLLESLDFDGWGEVDMVVGAAFPRPEDLATAAAGRGVRLHRGVPAADLARLLAGKRAALITGGMIVYEALATGVPAVVFPQMRNLCLEAEWFAQRGCILDLGYEGGFDAALVGRGVRGLGNDPAAGARMSAAQHAIGDGRGMQRAAAAIDALLSARSPG